MVIGKPQPLKIEVGTDAISALVFTPDGNQIIASSLNGAPQLWSLIGQGNRIRTYHAPDGAVWAMALSSDGAKLYCGRDDGAIVSYGVERGNVARRFVEHTEGVESLDISHDGRLVLSGSRDRTVILWDVTTGESVWRVTQSEKITCVAFMADKTAVFVGGTEGNGYVLDVAGGHVRGAYKGPSAIIAFSAASRTFACTTRRPTDKVAPLLYDFSIVGVHLDNGEFFKLPGSSNAVTTAVFSRDGRRMVSGTLDRSLKLWDLASETPLVAFGADAPLLSVAYSTDGKSMAGGTTNGMVYVVALP